MSETEPGIDFAPLIGHKTQIAQAEEGVTSGKMHHAWLLTGPEGIGKARFAHQLAASLIAYDDSQSALFGDPTPFRIALDEANPDMRQVMQSAHPDFLHIAPIQDEKNKSGMIKVEQIRALTPFFSHKSASGGWRVALLDNLDAVNLQGANAMLKIVEEPPEKAIILLVAKSAGSVLPTIRSRCRELRFAHLSHEEQRILLSSHLPDADPDALTQLALFSGGSMGYALEIAKTDALDLYEASCLILAKPQADASTLLDLSGKWGAARQKKLLPIAKQAFSRLLAQAALSAAGRPLPEGLMDCERTLIGCLQDASNSLALAELHDDFMSELSKAERAFLDMPAVFLSLFDKIHSLAHT
ncbi:MAG: DNA polymerase III subunit delta' [Candidatus Puniceispirillaceae bacterium]